MSEFKNDSPVNTESHKNQSEAAAGDSAGAGDTPPELKTELPVFKLHASVEFVVFIKAGDLPAATAKLKELKLGDKLKDHNITFLESIPYEQYKDFKVEIID